VSVVFAALLGYNPVQTLLGPAIAHLPASHAAYLTGRSFFPALISPSFSDGLSIAFDFAIAACLIAALASLLRGKRYIHEEHGQAADPQGAVVALAADTETARVETARGEAARVETAKGETARADTVRAEPTRAQTAAASSGPGRISRSG